MTTTTIMNRLEVDGLLTKQAKQRGRIGQPSIPFALNRGRRIFARSQDRTAELRARAGRFSRRRAGAPPRNLRLSCAKHPHFMGHQRAVAGDAIALGRGAGEDYGHRHRRTVRTLELGDRGRRAARGARRVALVRREGRDRPDHRARGSPLQRCHRCLRGGADGGQRLHVPRFHLRLFRRRSSAAGSC